MAPVLEIDYAGSIEIVNGGSVRPDRIASVSASMSPTFNEPSRSKSPRRQLRRTAIEQGTDLFGRQHAVIDSHLIQRATSR